MNKPRTWIITGAGRGMGLEFARKALAAGDNVVATGRSPREIMDELGPNPGLAVAELDITDPDAAKAAREAALDHFGRIDILVNSAGISYKGYFEEMTTQQIVHQLQVNLLGQMWVTREILPVMREQRSGLVVGISSGAGLAGFEFSSAYAASKFGLEGWLDALRKEVSPFGIQVMVVNPGFYRTELISEKSMTFAEPLYGDYDEQRSQQTEWWKGQAGKQPGNPARLAELLIKVCRSENPPDRLIAGNDIAGLAETRIKELKEAVDYYRKLDFPLEF